MFSKYKNYRKPVLTEIFIKYSQTVNKTSQNQELWINFLNIKTLMLMLKKRRKADEISST